MLRFIIPAAKDPVLRKDPAEIARLAFDTEILILQRC
jgi:hypothetical protein